MSGQVRGCRLSPPPWARVAPAAGCHKVPGHRRLNACAPPAGARPAYASAWHPSLVPRPRPYGVVTDGAARGCARAVQVMRLRVPCDAPLPS
ncbi:hypothetical protein PsYK624_045870 [Phanerochaete sordida]|uniref:Uncharacterized protein n=1 Tax=Phanerochaete sordida TaxID=48140 RepID=A0A9P3G6R9_9APHY|nr:hypothetical protein PsYK624_045870 [Phanerochaete sordida]